MSPTMSSQILTIVLVLGWLLGWVMRGCAG